MRHGTTSRGMVTFSVIWFGQLVSTLGSGLTGFALGVWVYQQTHSVTLFALNMLAQTLPNVLLAPIAGALADRWDRRRVMLLSDVGAGLSTLAIALLFLSGRLEVWHVYIVTAVGAACTAFQWPAYSAATTMLVPKQQLGRAGGMVQIGEAMGQLISPALAGALFVTIGLGGVILVDFATFGFAVLTLLAIRIPRPTETAEGRAGRGSLWQEAAYGWKYIAARPGLLGLLLYFASVNFLGGMIGPLIQPMILDMASPDVLGYVGSIMGVGMLFGTLVMSAWGGPQRRVYGVLGAGVVTGLFITLVGVRPSIPLIAFGGFGAMFAVPIMNASSQALWQSKVAADVQGRVFAVRRMIAWSTSPIAILIAGPLADNVFEPLLTVDGPLAGSVGQLIGVGDGRGTGLLFILLGLLCAFTSLVAWLSPRLRNVEVELPDAVSSEIPAGTVSPAGERAPAPIVEAT